MFGKRKLQNEVDALSFLWQSAINRLSPEAHGPTKAWFQGGAYGNGKVFLASAIQTGAIAKEDSSFQRDVFRPTFDELLNVAKQNFDITQFPLEREMQLTRDFLQRITQWLDVPEDWLHNTNGIPTKLHIEVLATVYVGAILDCYLRPRPLMKVAGALTAEACTEVTALTASTWLKEKRGKIV